MKDTEKNKINMYIYYYIHILSCYRALVPWAPIILSIVANQIFFTNT